MQRGPPVLVRHVRLGPAPQQRRDGVGVPVPGGPVQRHAALKELLQFGQIQTLVGILYSRIPTTAIWQLRIPCQDKFVSDCKNNPIIINHFLFSSKSICLVVRRIRPRAGVHQLLQDGGVSGDGRVVQRSHAELVGAVRIGVEVDENLKRRNEAQKAARNNRMWESRNLFGKIWLRA